jgi:hypothetical protein
MSLEGTIRDLGLHEVGQLLSLSRKSGVLSVSSLLRGRRAWIRFAEGAIVDAGADEPPGAGEATPIAASGSRPGVEEEVLDVLAWREGRFAFAPEPVGAASASRVRIPTDAMLVESARRDDAWQQLADRVPSADVVPSFVDVEPKALPLLRLVPQEWEVLTRVDGVRTLRTLAQLLQRDVIEVAGIVHRLVGTGLLTVRDGAAVRRVATPPSGDIVESELWIPPTAEMAVFDADADPDDLVFDPLRAGLLTPHGSPRITPQSVSIHDTQTPARTVTPPAHRPVAFEGAETSLSGSPTHAVTDVRTDASDLREHGDSAARRGDFTLALTHWSAYLRVADQGRDADRVREAIGLAARLQALLNPASTE